MRSSPLRWIVFALVALVAACGRGGADRQPGPARIVVSIPPLEGLARALAPEAEIVTLLPPGMSEHGFELTPGAIAATGRADLVVLVGAGLEPQVERLLKAQGERAGREVIRFGDVVGVHADPHAGHDHGPGEACEHDHGGVDPHLWLDPALVEQFVPELAAAVARVAGDAESVTEHAMAFLERVRDVDRAHRSALEPFSGKAIVTQHGAFSRLAERYGLRIAAVLRAGETTEPTPALIAEVARLAREGEIAAIFAEPQSSAAEAERLAERAGLRVGVLDPLGSGDWEALMRGNLEALVEGLSGGR